MSFPPKPQAIATLITTNEFVPGAQTFFYSVKKTMAALLDGEYPPELLLLATRNVDTKHLSKFCHRIIIVDLIPSPHTSGNDTCSSNGWDYTKLHLWSLTSYSQILYVDADCLVLKDIFHLLRKGKHNSDHNVDMVTAVPDIHPPDKFNAGVLLFSPSRLVYDDMMEKIPTLPSYDGGDTGFLNAYYPGWFASSNRLPFRYNAQRSLYHTTKKQNPAYWDSIDSKLIIHYSSTPKPWMVAKSICQKVGNELESMWWDWYDESRYDGVKQKGKPTAAAAASPSCPNQKQQHWNVSARFKELRKQGLVSKDAMLQAKKDCGVHDNDVDVSGQVASLFGIQ